MTSLAAILRGKPVRVYGRVKPIDILFNLEHPDAPEVITEVNEDDGTDEEDTSEEDIADASEDELLKRFDRMAFVVYSKKLAAIRHWVSVTNVFREASNTPFLKAAGVTSMDDPRYEKYDSRLKRLRAIGNYQHCVNILDHDKLYEEVTEIFVRVNSLYGRLA